MYSPNSSYVSHIGALIAKYQITNGGPVILYQPENEYSGGCCGAEFPDAEYFQYVIDQARRAGIGPSRAVTLTQKETFRKLLVEMFPKVDGGGWQNLGEIGERVRDIPMGCSIIYINPEGDDKFRYVS